MPVAGRALLVWKDWMTCGLGKASWRGNGKPGYCEVKDFKMSAVYTLGYFRILGYPSCRFQPQFLFCFETLWSSTPRSCQRIQSPVGWPFLWHVEICYPIFQREAMLWRDISGFSQRTCGGFDRCISHHFSLCHETKSRVPHVDGRWNKLFFKQV